MGRWWASLRYEGECGVCHHKAGPRITAMILSGTTRWALLKQFPDLTHRDLNMHVQQCVLPRMEKETVKQGGK